MLRTAILRFSDAEVPTIETHRAIINEKGYAWWGWWKKQAEPSPRSFLEYLRDATGREPLRIGLLNRKGNEYFAVGNCNAVAIGDAGALIPSPDLTATPEYYRCESFPAWFRFTCIKEIARHSFVREFGDVPSLDQPCMKSLKMAGRSS